MWCVVLEVFIWYVVESNVYLDFVGKDVWFLIDWSKFMYLCLCGYINIFLEYFYSCFLFKLSRDFKIDYICYECYYFNYISVLVNVRCSCFGYWKKWENYIDVYEM